MHIKSTPSIRKRLQNLGIMLGLFLFLYQVNQSVLRLFHSNIVVKSYILIILILLLGIFFNFIQMLNWKLILRGLSLSISLKETIKNFPKTFLPRYIPGSIWGYLSRGEWLLTKFGISHKMNIYISLVETIIPLSALLFLFAGIYLRVNFTIFLFSTIVILFGFWLLIEFFRNNVFPQMGFSEDKYFFPLKSWLIGNLIFSLNWVIMGLITVGLIEVLSDPIEYSLLWSVQNIWNATVTYAIAWLGGFLVLFVPAGMGVREVLFRLLLVQFMGVSSETALLVAVASRFISLLSEGIWLIIGMLIKD